MDGKPRVSVIIGIFNGERFLAETVASVFAQTCTDWELLLVDDGSADQSAGIARRYAEQHPQSVRYLEHFGHRRRGQGATRNLGIKHATGEFIAILDHDDVWLPRKLERQVALLDSYPEVAIVCGASRYWYSWAGAAPGQDADYEQSLGVPPNRIYRPPDLLKPTLSEQVIPPIPTDMMFRKESICNLGGFEESFIGALSMFEDQAFLVKIYANLQVYISDECWDLYRIHPDQHCAKVIRSGRKLETEYFFLSWASEYLAMQGLLDSEIEAIIRRRKWPYDHPLFARAKRAGKLLAAKARRAIHRRWDEQPGSEID